MNPLSIAINRKFVGKMPTNASDKEWNKYNGNFRNESVTISELANLIQQGFGYTTWHKAWRKGENFIQGQHIGLDFDTEDESSTLPALIKDPVVSQYAAIVHTTSSHTSEKPRARVIFVFDDPITDPIEYTDLAKALLWKYGTADTMCKDACRLFYGAKDCAIEILDNVMPLSYAREALIEPYREEIRQKQRLIDKNRQIVRQKYGNVVAPDDVKTKYVEAAIAKEVANVMCASEGTQHSARLNASIKLGSLLKSDWIVAGSLDEQRIYDEIITAWQQSSGGDKSGTKNVENTIRDGISYAEPRPEPVWKKDGNEIVTVCVNSETGEILEPEQHVPDFDIFKYKAEDGGVLDFWREHYGEEWVYATGWETWLRWEGRHWQKDNVNGMSKEIQDTLNMLNDRAEEKQREISQKRSKVEGDAEDPNRKVELKKLDTLDKKTKAYVTATKRTNGRVSGIIEMGKAYRSVPSENFDGGNILNLYNGTINLDTLEFHPHTKSDHQTYALDYPYIPTAKAERWEKYLREVIVRSEEDNSPDVDTILHLQEIVGYSLTTHTKEEKMVWLAGDGGNGKSVFVKTIRRLLGNLVRSVDFQTLGKSGNYDLATLVGVRMVVSTESNKGEGLSESVLKNVVSGDTINVRPIYGKPFDLTPVCKVWWAMNNLPVIRGTDDSIWRRLSLVNFFRRFGEDEKDTTLTDALTAEMPGILNWALVGLRRFMENKKFTKSKSVEVAVEEYRRESNPVIMYLEERTTTVDGRTSPSSQLHMDYQLWCKDTARNPMNSTNFGKELKRLKIPKSRDGDGNRYALVLKSQASRL